MNKVKVPGAKCDFCDRPAAYDGPLRNGGPWAYACENCAAYELAFKATAIDASEEVQDASKM